MFWADRYDRFAPVTGESGQSQFAPLKLRSLALVPSSGAQSAPTNSTYGSSTVRLALESPLAKLNAEGIPASCEGDIPALVTMAVGNALTGQCGLQANPARINPSSGEYLFAHCTVPLNMVRSYEYDTHFESGLRVAIRGVLPEGNATIFKLSGDLTRSFVAPAQLLRNQAEPGLCRTQVVLSAEGCAEYFLRGPIGNHYIIFCGDFAELFRTFVSVVQ